MCKNWFFFHWEKNIDFWNRNDFCFAVFFSPLKIGLWFEMIELNIDNPLGQNKRAITIYSIHFMLGYGGFSTLLLHAQTVQLTVVKELKAVKEIFNEDLHCWHPIGFSFCVKLLRWNYFPYLEVCLTSMIFAMFNLAEISMVSDWNKCNLSPCCVYNANYRLLFLKLVFNLHFN